MLRVLRVMTGPTLLAALLAAPAPATVPPPTLDPAFGTNGRTPLAEQMDGEPAVALAADRIAVASGVREGIAFARYTADGRLDPTFGDGGTALLRSPLEASTSWMIDTVGLVAAPDGTLSTRYHDNASLNRGGEDSPLCTALVGPAGDVASMQSGLDCDPPLVGSMLARPGGGRFIVGRDGDATVVQAYAPDGAPDLAWGDGGRAPVPASADVVVGATGDLLAVGERSVVRLDAAGRQVARVSLPADTRSFPVTGSSAAVGDGVLTVRSVGRGRRCRLVVLRVSLPSEGAPVVAQRRRRLERCLWSPKVGVHRHDAAVVLSVTGADGRFRGIPAGRMLAVPIGAGDAIGTPVKVGRRTTDTASVAGIVTLPDGRVVALHEPNGGGPATLFAFAPPP